MFDPEKNMSYAIGIDIVDFDDFWWGGEPVSNVIQSYKRIRCNSMLCKINNNNKNKRMLHQVLQLMESNATFLLP